MTSSSFPAYLRSLDPPLGPATVQLYLRIARRWDPRLDGSRGPRGYVRRLQETGPLAPGTLSSIRPALRHWLRWQGHEEAAEQPLGLRTRKGRVARTSLEVEGLAAYRASVGRLPEPHRTILLLLPLTGLRIAEACGLRWDDVKVADGTPPVPYLAVTGKGQKLREVPLSREAYLLLQAWEATAGADVTVPLSPWVFPGRGADGPVSPSTVRERLRDVRQAARLPRVTPHVLRHTFATGLLEDGVDIKTVQELLGHSDPRTTMVYLHPSLRSKAAAVGRLGAGRPGGKGAGSRPARR